MADDQPMYIRIKAAEAWIKLDLAEGKQARQADDAESQKFDRATLLAMLSEKLTSSHTAALLRRQMEQESGGPGNVIDGHLSENQGQLLPPEE